MKKKNKQFCDFHRGHFYSDIFHSIDGDQICPACFAKKVVDSMAFNAIPDVDAESLLKMVRVLMEKVMALAEETEHLCMIKTKIERGKMGIENR